MRTVFLFLLINFFYITSTYADIASKIINNLEKTRNYNFKFIQKINNKKESGNCILVFDRKLNCRYNNSGKILISDGKNLIIKNKNSDFPNFYKLKNTSFYKLLDKSYLINQLKSSDIKNRKEPSNLAKVYVRSKNTGKLVSISNLVSLEEEGIAPILSRYNRQKAITISANIVGDYSLSDALNFLEKTTNDNFPSARIAYKGESEELRETSYQIYLIFALALLTAYLVMAAQFESFKHPFTIMLTVPLAIFGGILGLLVVGSSINIFSQIALIILIGLATKNGILIVEFANQLRDEGKDIEKSIIESANIRLRPILMTSISTIIGVLPLVFSSGPGEASRLTVGITILFGMIFSTFFTLYVIPTIYLAIGKNTKSINHIEKELKKQLD